MVYHRQSGINLQSMFQKAVLQASQNPNYEVGGGNVVIDNAGITGDITVEVGDRVDGSTIVVRGATGAAGTITLLIDGATAAGPLAGGATAAPHFVFLDNELIAL